MIEGTFNPDLAIKNISDQTVGAVYTENARISTRDLYVFYGRRNVR